ncbi:hypothetical protein QYM36_004226 [Artemia franciscana]|nr:hypothetical protein QYM36_004226 [Artemia franciscana]
MPLTEDASGFSNQVKRAAVSGNLDAPEGGFDAIMQAVVCKEQIAWRDRARRLLVFSTDAGFHYAGDGKLGGIVKPNDGKCHLENGQYTHSTIQDYPSVSQINQKVKENSINLIFAVTADQLPVYEQLSNQVEGAFAGKLDQDSSNVVELVKEQYDKISSFVELKDNATSHVRVTYFSSCLSGGAPVQTNKCDGLKVGTVVNFTAKIEAVSCPTDPREWNQLLQIYPVGINESLILDLELLCSCDCEKPGNNGYKEEAEECNGVGTLKCGVCDCDDTHFGRVCECDNNDSINVVDSEAGCRPDNTTDILCNDRGACVCGECQCYARPNPLEVVSGPYCECDNFLCENNNGLLCSGPDHGTCVCGECQCLPGWTGSDCSCRDTIDTCIPPGGGEVCSGKGECICGTCECVENEQGRYSGKYCEECPTCPGKCLEYKACVQCQVFNSGELKGDDCRNCTFVPISVDVAQPENDDEKLCSFYDDDNCRFTFVYGYGENGEPVVRVQKTKECPPILDILGIVLGVVGAIVAVGFALLLIWKFLTVLHDRREFARFEKERQMAKWDTGENPIYKQATSTFKNPTYGGK